VADAYVMPCFDCLVGEGRGDGWWNRSPRRVIEYGILVEKLVPFQFPLAGVPIRAGRYQLSVTIS
jgi:hypothetical protein